MQLDENELPEQYRDPAKLKETLARVQDLERDATQYKDFYDKQYMPWVTEHGTTFQEYTREADAYRQWKARHAGQTADQEPTTRREPPDPTPLNFDDPDALEKAYHRLDDNLEHLRSTYETEIASLKTALENERTNVYQLVALQEQAYGLLNSELYDHLGWKPTTNIRDVASYAKDHGLADLTEAAQQLYRSNREQALEHAAYERAKRDLEQQYKNERVTTEMGGGTPLPQLRGARPEGLVRGYGNANTEAMQRAIAERRAARRMASS